jgi:hypothetical protein
MIHILKHLWYRASTEGGVASGAAQPFQTVGVAVHRSDHPSPRSGNRQKGGTAPFPLPFSVSFPPRLVTRLVQVASAPSFFSLPSTLPKSSLALTVHRPHFRWSPKSLYGSHPSRQWGGDSGRGFEEGLGRGGVQPGSAVPRAWRGGDQRWDILGRLSGVRSARNAASNARTAVKTSASAATNKLSLLLYPLGAFPVVR